MQEILSNYTATVAELQTDPLSILSCDEPVAIFDQNKAVSYCIPPDLYDRMMDIIEDIQLKKIVEERKGQSSVSVSWDELCE